MSSNSSEGTSMDVLRNKLFKKVMDGKWEEVIEIYKEDRRAYKTKITSSGHTALHLAIAQDKEDVVETLMMLIMNNERNTNDVDEVVSDAKEILRMQTERGHTPLHIAAARGSKRMCGCIVGIDKSLVLARNKKGETPLFRAVVYGQKRAFHYLHTIAHSFARAENVDVKFYCCRKDGQSILHNAIIMENFDLAFQIIYLYKELANCVDETGESPLHALARKSAAFRSGNNLQGRNKIIYNSAFVKELESDDKALLEEYSDPNQGLKDKNPSLPENKRSIFLNFTSFLSRNGTQAERDGLRAFRENACWGRWSGVLPGCRPPKFAGEVAEVTRDECVPLGVWAVTGMEPFKGHGKKDNNVDLERQTEPQHCFSASDLCSYFEYFIQLVRRAIFFMVFGFGHTSITKIQRTKEKHVWAFQVLKELLKYSTTYKLNDDESDSHTNSNFREDSDDEDLRGQDDSANDSSNITEQPIFDTNMSEAARKDSGKEIKDTPILIAAKYGIAEMVEEILKRFPVAIYDRDKDSKTVLLVTVENRNLQVYKILIKRYLRKPFVLQRVDKDGNTALHYAAKYAEHIKPWPVPGAALQMQWEIRWHEFVENTMPSSLYLRTNLKGETPSEMFSDTHKALVKAGGKWLTSTATSCSVVATLIATVAFASSTTIPGGNDSKGNPTLKRSLTFELLFISSLVALCFSVTSLIIFLAILTSRHQEKDFGKDLPRKILFGLSSLFVSIASMLVTFCASHFLVFEDKFKHAAFPVYVATLFPLCLFAAAQFPLYFDLLIATFWSPFRVATI